MTVLVVAVTLGLSFSRGEVETIHIFFGVTIIFLSLPELVLVRWFRQGNLDPKFRYLIGYQMVTIILICVCAIVYFYQKEKGVCP